MKSCLEKYQERGYKMIAKTEEDFNGLKEKYIKNIVKVVEVHFLTVL